MTSTPLDFLPPRALPPPEWVAKLATMLEARRDIGAACYLTMRYVEPPPTLQDELRFELEVPRRNSDS